MLWARNCMNSRRLPQLLLGSSLDLRQHGSDDLVLVFLLDVLFPLTRILNVMFTDSGVYVLGITICSEGVEEECVPFGTSLDTSNSNNFVRARNVC